MRMRVCVHVVVVVAVAGAHARVCVCGCVCPCACCVLVCVLGGDRAMAGLRVRLTDTFTLTGLVHYITLIIRRKVNQ